MSYSKRLVLMPSRKTAVESIFIGARLQATHPNFAPQTEDSQLGTWCLPQLASLLKSESCNRLCPLPKPITSS